MMDERRGRETVVTQAANIVARYIQLSPAQQAIVTTDIRGILAERGERNAAAEHINGGIARGL